MGYSGCTGAGVARGLGRKHYDIGRLRNEGAYGGVLIGTPADATPLYRYQHITILYLSYQREPKDRTNPEPIPLRGGEAWPAQ